MDNSTQTTLNVLSPGNLHSHADSIPKPERLSPGSSYTAPLPQHDSPNYEVYTRSSAISPTLQVVSTPERSHRRPWPLRDPEEARLLRHFVEKVAPFVSDDILFCMVSGILTIISSLIARIASSILPSISLTEHAVARRYLMQYWPCQLVI